MRLLRTLGGCLLVAFLLALAADVHTQQSIPRPPGDALTASRAMASDANGVPSSATTTLTELNRLSGVTSGVQTQLDAKLPLAGGVMTGNLDLDGRTLIINAAGTTTLADDGTGVLQTTVGGNPTTRLSSAGILDLRWSDDGASVGPALRLVRISASPAVNDQVGSLEFYGRNLSSTDIVMARLMGVITDATAGSEDGYLSLSAPLNAVQTEAARIFGTGLRLMTKTATTVPYLDANKELVSSAVTPTELGYLSGVNGLRVKLTADRTYYVATTGNDANDCLAIGTPCLTPQHAVDLATANVDTGTFYNVNVQLADGTYTGLVNMARPLVGGGRLTLVGNTGTPANVIYSVTSNDAITASNPGVRLYVSGMELRTTTSGSCLRSTLYATLTISTAMRFGACATVDMQADGFGTIQLGASYTIAGNSGAHFNAQQQGIIGGSSITVTLTGTPAFSTAFALAGSLSAIYTPTITFSGSGTGTRYNATLNSVIFTNGGGASYFPGSVAGSVATGGQYN